MVLGEFSQRQYRQHELDSTLDLQREKGMLEKIRTSSRPHLYKNMAAKAARTRSDRGSGLLPKSKERKWPVAIYCTSREEARLMCKRECGILSLDQANLGRDS